jgi:DNA-binding MarR family transcriptional regulator
MLAISENPDISIEQLSGLLGLTQRRVTTVIKDLEDGGYLTRTKQGRRNHYRINTQATLRHSTSANRTVNDLLAGLSHL